MALHLIGKMYGRKVDFSKFPNMPSKNRDNIYYTVINISRFIPLSLSPWNYQVQTQGYYGI